jgi:hypothetical protein
VLGALTRSDVADQDGDLTTLLGRARDQLRRPVEADLGDLIRLIVRLGSAK